MAEINDKSLGSGNRRIQNYLAEKDRRQPATEFAWVIEQGSGSDLRYYAPTAPGEWSKDHLKACRFARKEDAEAIQFRHVTHCDRPVDDTRVCEHGWG